MNISKPTSRPNSSANSKASPNSNNSTLRPVRRSKNNTPLRRTGWHDTRTPVVILAALTFTFCLQIIVIDYYFFSDSIKPSENNLLRGDASILTEPKLATSIGGGIRPFEEILKKAGANMTAEMRESLPSPHEAEKMYGKKPVILGLETCKTFVTTIDLSDAFIGPAGMFNTGTNLMAELLKKNCHIPDKMKKCRAPSCPGMREQVPWGKHTPVSWRLHHTAQSGGKISHRDFLPIVVVKDPYTWMASMCRHVYAASWLHSAAHCPNLVPLGDEKRFIKSSSVPVTVNYSPVNKTHHDSLVGLWNDWYGDWLHADFPRLIVRSEDLMFWTEEIVQTVCECGGGVLLHDEVEYIVDSAKASKGKVHQGSNGLVDALKRYGNETKRSEPFQKEDLEYAKGALSDELMTAFQYSKINL